MIPKRPSMLLLFLCVILCSAFFIKSETRSREELKLLNKLFKTYNKNQKPDGTVKIKFALNLNSIVKINAQGVVELNTFLDHAWEDNRLSWKPEENHNITLLRMNSAKLWTPDTFIYTTADSSGFLLPQQGAYFVVSHDGQIFWPNPLPQMNVRCELQFAWFPFDDQLCTIVFGSWSNSQKYLNYSLMNEDSALAGYDENSEWSLIQYKGFRKEAVYDNWIEEDPFSEIHYKILIRRKPLFVLQNYCIPAIMLCIILLYLFYVPFAQEILLGINIMLTFSILKLRLNSDTPVQSNSIPLFSIYFTLCMFSALMGIIWFQQKNLHDTKKKLPHRYRNFIYHVVCHIFKIPRWKEVETEVKTEGENIEGKVQKMITMKERKRINYTDAQLMVFFNDFIFSVFVLYYILLNVILLLVLPYFFKPDLSF